LLVKANPRNQAPQEMKAKKKSPEAEQGMQEARARAKCEVFNNNPPNHPSHQHLNQIRNPGRTGV
jgi:hypothetical protein